MIKKLPKVVVKAIKKELKPKVTKKVVVASATAPEFPEVVGVVNTESSAIIASITHPNKKILAEKMLNGVPVEELINQYGNTRVSEMNSYIQSYGANLNKNSALKAKRGCNGVCLACQK